MYTGESERLLNVNFFNNDLLSSAVKVGKCVNILVQKSSQTIIVQNKVRIILDCSQLQRNSSTRFKWLKIALDKNDSTIGKKLCFNYNINAII